MKVSVIIPTHNCFDYIEESIRSVLSQTFTDLEVIVVNDGSTDATENLLSEIAKEDPRLRVLKNESAKGVSVARNQGIQVATGQYISFLDADDVNHPEKIEVQVDVFKKLPDVDIVFGNLPRFTSDISNIDSFHLKGSEFIISAADYLEQVAEDTYLCKHNFYSYMSISATSISTQTIMFKRNLLHKVDDIFPEDLTIGEDIDLWFRLVRMGKVAYINKTLAYYRYRPGSATSNPVAALRGFVQVHTRNLNRGFEDFTKEDIIVYKKRIACNWQDLGYHYFCEADVVKARLAYSAALKLDFSHRVLLLYCKTLLPRVLLLKILPIWRKLRK